MAWSGWSINATPTFRGLSYDEWAKPLEQATKLHQEVETQYGELDAKASMWDKLANDALGKDSNAYKQYKKYADDLRAQADELAKNGLGYNSRKNMLNMVGRYSKEITPIEEAWERRKELAKQQNELLAKNPSMMTNRLAGKESIDFFMDNPEWNYNTLDLKEYYARTREQAGDYSKQLITAIRGMAGENVGKGEVLAENLKWLKSSVPGFYERYIAKGYDPKTLSEALANPDSDVNRLLQTELAATGMEDWDFAYSYNKDTGKRYENDEERVDANRRGYLNAANRFMNYISGGLTAAYGDIEFDKLEDKPYLMALDYGYQQRLQNARFAHDKDMFAAKLAAKNGPTTTPTAQYMFTEGGSFDSLADANDVQTAIKIRAANEMSKIDYGDEKTNEFVRNASEGQIEKVIEKVKTRLGGKYEDSTINFNDPNVRDIVKEVCTGTPIFSSPFMGGSKVRDYMKKYNYKSFDEELEEGIASGRYSSEQRKVIENNKNEIAGLEKELKELKKQITFSGSSLPHEATKQQKERVKFLENEIAAHKKNIREAAGISYSGAYDYDSMYGDIHDSKRTDIGKRSTNTNDSIMYSNFTGSLSSDPNGISKVTISEGKNSKTVEMVNNELLAWLNGEGAGDYTGKKNGVMTFTSNYNPDTHTYTVYNTLPVGNKVIKVPMNRRDLNLAKDEYENFAKSLQDLSYVVYGDGETTYQMGAYTAKQKEILKREGIWDGKGKPPSRDKVVAFIQRKSIGAMRTATGDQMYRWSQQRNQGFNGYRSGVDNNGSTSYYGPGQSGAYSSDEDEDEDEE